MKKKNFKEIVRNEPIFTENPQMIWTHVFTHLKGPDLTAMTAFETLTETMGFKGLKGLRRFTHFEIQIGLEKDIPFLDDLCRSPYYLYNPTKEVAYMNKLPLPMSGYPFIYVDIFPKSQNESRSKPFGEDDKSWKKLKWQSFTSILWELELESHDTNWPEMVYSKNRKQGLLANPISEDAFIMCPNTFRHLERV